MLPKVVCQKFTGEVGIFIFFRSPSFFCMLYRKFLKLVIFVNVIQKLQGVTRDWGHFYDTIQTVIIFSIRSEDGTNRLLCSSVDCSSVNSEYLPLSS